MGYKAQIKTQCSTSIHQKNSATSIILESGQWLHLNKWKCINFTKAKDELTKSKNKHKHINTLLLECIGLYMPVYLIPAMVNWKENCVRIHHLYKDNHIKPGNGIVYNSHLLLNDMYMLKKLRKNQNFIQICFMSLGAHSKPMSLNQFFWITRMRQGR